MSRVAARYVRAELRDTYWAECSECGETIVVALTPDGLARLDTVTDGSASDQPTYEPHDCPTDKEP